MLLPHALRAAAGNIAPAQTDVLYEWGFRRLGSLGGNYALENSGPSIWGTGGSWSYLETTHSTFLLGQIPTGLGIKTDGTLWSWGRGPNGELGTNVANLSLASTQTPTQVGAGTNWSKLKVNTTVLAIKTDGTLWSWGRGSSGQLGNSGTTNRSSPIQIGAGTDWSYVESSNEEGCFAIKTDGTLWAWGNNTNGQLGHNDRINKSSPVQVGALTNWASVVTHNSRTLAIKTDGTLWSWGVGSGGTLGTNNPTQTRSSPVQVGALTDWSKVYVMETSAWAIKTDGTLWSWGESADGQGARGNIIARSSPVQVGSDTNWDSVATSVYYTALSTADQVAIFRKTDGTIYSAGDGGSFGTDGRGGFALPARSSPVQIGAGDTWNAIFGRYSPALFVINSSGVVHKWGVGSTGAIGERPYTTSPTSTETYNWNKVTTYGEFVGAGIKNDGTLWTMGSNTSGGIGQNSDLSYSSPVQVGSATDWSDVASGFRLGLAVKTGGTLWSWGTNATGALGQNVANTLNRSSPVQVGALTNWSKVYAGGTDTSQAVAAIKTDGTLWTWGAGANGFTGLNIAANRSSPVQVGALTNWSKVSVAAGGNHMLAIKTDGTLWAWGLNGNGQLGQNNIIARSSPVQIGALTTWTSAAAGPTFSAAVRSDGTLWVWGLGTNGISGNSNAVTRSSPVQVGVGTDWSSVYTLTTAALGAVKTNGTLWAWGANTTADLGDGTLISRSSPVQIGSLTPWREVVNTGANNPGAIYQ